MKPMALLISHTTLFALAAGLGWGLHAGPEPGPAAAPPARSAPAPAVHDDALIAISDDGRATLRVEQQPLDWVLEEIERQSGRKLSSLRHTSSVGSAASAASSVMAPMGEPSADSCSVTAEPGRRTDPRRLLLAIENGSENERFEGLQQAREDGVPVAPTLLRSVFETDASERVRLAAFEAWLESLAGRPEQLRPLLESALNHSGTAVPAEARRRLDELRQAERPDPDDPQPHAGP